MVLIALSGINHSVSFTASTGDITEAILPSKYFSTHHQHYAILNIYMNHLFLPFTTLTIPSLLKFSSVSLITHSIFHYPSHPLSTDIEEPRPEINSLSPAGQNVQIVQLETRELLNSNCHDQISVIVPFRSVCWVEGSHWVLGYLFLHLEWPF